MYAYANERKNKATSLANKYNNLARKIYRKSYEELPVNA